MFRPKLFELCDNFEQLISVNSSQRPIVQHLEDTIKKNQLRDLFNLGVLLDSILEIDKSSLVNQQNENNENVNVANFILACQKAKSVEELLDHNYLIHGFFEHYLILFLKKKFFFRFNKSF